MPLIYNIRQDPFERTPSINAETLNNQGGGYMNDFYGREFWRFVLVQQRVADLAKTAIEYAADAGPSQLQSRSRQGAGRGGNQEPRGAIGELNMHGWPMKPPVRCQSGLVQRTSTARGCCRTSKKSHSSWWPARYSLWSASARVTINKPRPLHLSERKVLAPFRCSAALPSAPDLEKRTPFVSPIR